MRAPHLAVLALVAGAAAQEPAPAPPGPEVVRAAEALLRAQAAKGRSVQVLVADYVQRRTTKLAKEPLLSRGQFVFVRSPGCIVFRAKEPRESVIRLRADTYEVHRPQKKQLERFVLDGPELALGLFAALAGDADTLLREFSVSASGPDPARKDHTLVVLAPRRDAVRERLSELRLCIAKDGDRLASIAYRDAQGDLVEIELQNTVSNPKQPPSVEFDLPPDTVVVEHKAPKKSG